MILSTLGTVGIHERETGVESGKQQVKVAGAFIQATGRQDMSDDSKEFMAWVDALAKGIIAGCAIGYLFSLSDLMPTGRAVVMGGLCGCLASITFKNKRDDRKE